MDDKLGHDFGDVLEELARKIAVPEGSVVVSKTELEDLRKKVEQYSQWTIQWKENYEKLQKEYDRSTSEVQRLQKENEGILEISQDASRTAERYKQMNDNLSTEIEALKRISLKSRVGGEKNVGAVVGSKDHTTFRQSTVGKKYSVVRRTNSRDCATCCGTGNIYMLQIYKIAPSMTVNPVIREAKCYACHGNGSISTDGPPMSCAKCNGLGYTEKIDKVPDYFNVRHISYVGRNAKGPWYLSCGVCGGRGLAHSG